MNNKINRKRPGEEKRLQAEDEPLYVGDAHQESQAPPATERPEPVREDDAITPDPDSQQEIQKPEHPGSRPGRTSPLGSPQELRAAWEKSVLSARNDPRKWSAYSVSLPEELWERIEARAVADQARYGLPSVAMSHYINAALGLIPRSAKGASALATEHAQGYGLVPPTMRPSGTRVHADVQARLQKLRPQLRRHARPGLLGHLQAAAVTALLNGLDEEEQTT